MVLKPITREALRAFYLDYPLQPVPAEADALLSRLKTVAEALQHHLPGLSQVADRTHFATPTRIDDCFWRSRQLCEEVAEHLSRVSKAASTWSDVQGNSAVPAAVEACRAKLLTTEARVRAVQEANTAAATKQVKQFLPKDFRSSLLEMRQLSQEAKNRKAVDELVKQGGTIRDRYDLYLKQQWARREALAQFGNLSGMYAAFVKLLAGVPQVLLDFAKEINAKQGPMEEQRIKYGPDFYKVTTLGIRLGVLTVLWAEALTQHDKDQDQDKQWQQQWQQQQRELLEVVVASTDCYTEQLARVAEFIGDLFVKSPFFLTTDDGKDRCSNGSTSGMMGKTSMLALCAHAAAAAAATTAPAEADSNHSSLAKSKEVAGAAGQLSLAGPHRHAHHAGSPALVTVPEHSSIRGAKLHEVASPGAAGVSKAEGLLGPVGEEPCLQHLHRLSGTGTAKVLSTTSITSDCWMSADDNHSWYEPSRSSVDKVDVQSLIVAEGVVIGLAQGKREVRGVVALAEPVGGADKPAGQHLDVAVAHVGSPASLQQPQTQLKRRSLGCFGCAQPQQAL